MSISTDQRLMDHLQGVADQLAVPFGEWSTEEYPPLDGEEFTAWDYLDDVLDITYRVRRNRELIGAELLLTYGGPNIYLDTGSMSLRGYWWGNSAELFLDLDHAPNIEELNEALRELFVS